LVDELQEFEKERKRAAFEFQRLCSDCARDNAAASLCAHAKRSS